MCALAALLASTCSKEETPGTTPGADAAAPRLDMAPAGGQDMAPAGGNVDTGTPPAGPPKSCGGIRNCVQACGADATCSKRCVDDAPADARTKYRAAAMCTMQGCPSNDEVCRCAIECDAPSDCIDLVDECVGLDEDMFCTATCR